MYRKLTVYYKKKHHNHSYINLKTIAVDMETLMVAVALSLLVIPHAEVC